MSSRSLSPSDPRRSRTRSLTPRRRHGHDVETATMARLERKHKFHKAYATKGDGHTLCKPLIKYVTEAIALGSEHGFPQLSKVKDHIKLLAVQLRYLSGKWIVAYASIAASHDFKNYKESSLKKLRKLKTALEKAMKDRGIEGLVSTLEVFCNFWIRMSKLLHADATAGLRDYHWSHQVPTQARARSDLFPPGFLYIGSNGGATDEIRMLQTETEAFMQEQAKKFHSLWSQVGEYGFLRRQLPENLTRNILEDYLGLFTASRNNGEIQEPEAEP